jgi:hypothetical protein
MKLRKSLTKEQRLEYKHPVLRCLLGKLRHSMKQPEFQGYWLLDTGARALA